MGKLKLFMKSVIFSTRSRRRFIPFVLIFSILSGGTIILLDYFNNFSRAGLLEHRGIVIEVNDPLNPANPLTLAEAEAHLNIQDGNTRTGASAVIFYKFVNFGTNLRIFSINPNYPWAFSELKPNNLISGHYPHSNKDILVSEDAVFSLEATEGGERIFTKPVIGTSFTLGEGLASGINLRVSGIFRKPDPSLVKNDENYEWILVTEGTFNSLVSDDYLNRDDDEINIHSISIIASGDVFSGEAYNNVDSIASEYLDLEDRSEYNSVDFVNKSDKDEQRNMTFLSLIFGLFGTFIVSTLYSYLITRFRRREVAVLKAMGYGKWDVRIVVLTEILVVAITGFIFGLAAIQLYIWNPLGRTTSYVYWIIFSTTTFWAFLAVVASCIPGFIIITWRILGVRPIEIFRQK